MVETVPYPEEPGTFCFGCVLVPVICSLQFKRKEFFKRKEKYIYLKSSTLYKQQVSQKKL